MTVPSAAMIAAMRKRGINTTGAGTGGSAQRLSPEPAYGPPRSSPYGGPNRGATIRQPSMPTGGTTYLPSSNGGRQYTLNPFTGPQVPPDQMPNRGGPVTPPGGPMGGPPGGPPMRPPLYQPAMGIGGTHDQGGAGGGPGGAGVGAFQPPAPQMPPPQMGLQPPPGPGNMAAQGAQPPPQQLANQQAMIAAMRGRMI